MALAVYIAAVQPLGPEPMITTSLGVSISSSFSISLVGSCVFAGGIMVLVAVACPTTAAAEEEEGRRTSIQIHRKKKPTNLFMVLITVLVLLSPRYPSTTSTLQYAPRDS